MLESIQLKKCNGQFDFNRTILNERFYPLVMYIVKLNIRLVQHWFEMDQKCEELYDEVWRNGQFDPFKMDHYLKPIESSHIISLDQNRLFIVLNGLTVFELGRYIIGQSLFRSLWTNFIYYYTKILKKPQNRANVSILNMFYQVRSLLVHGRKWPYGILESIWECVFDFCVTFIHNCGSVEIIFYHDFYFKFKNGFFEYKNQS